MSSKRFRSLQRVAPVLVLVLVVAFGSSCASTPGKDNGLIGLMSHCVRTNHRSTDDGAPGLTEDMASFLAGSVQPFPYRVSPGDVLDISFFRKPFDAEAGDYRVDCMDELTIKVLGQAVYSTDVQVRPDGKISFYRIGEVDARGRTVADIQQEITTRFRETIPSVEVTVFLKQGGVMVTEFLTALRGGGNIGTVRTARVRQDGQATLPLLGELPLVGLKVPEMITTIQEQYADVFLGGLAVAIDVRSSTAGNLAVLGEVAKPGLFTIHRPLRPVYALAMAGGELLTADLANCVVVRKINDKEYARFRVNLDMRSGAGMANIVMGPEDILIVPASGIANVDRWVDQYIRRVLPFRASVSGTYRID